MGRRDLDEHLTPEQLRVRIKPPAKMGNSPTERDGIKFQSKREAERWDELVMLRAAGKVQMFLRQPLFDTGGGTTYRADFLIVWDDGVLTIEDVKPKVKDGGKAYRTPAFKRSKKQVESLYPIEILEI